MSNAGLKSNKAQIERKLCGYNKTIVLAKNFRSVRVRLFFIDPTKDILQIQGFHWTVIVSKLQGGHVA